MHTGKPYRKRSYSLAHLLEKQPAGLRRHPLYRDMLLHYRSSEKLGKVRFGRRCYSLLLHARISPHNLENFYRTYRLPRDPFFPLYFKLKRDHLLRLEARRMEKEQWIADKMKTLPANVFRFLLYLAALEKQLNSTGKAPLWGARLFPSSKKTVNGMLEFSTAEWADRFSRHMEELEKRYRRFRSEDGEKVLSWFVLELLPDGTVPYREVVFGKSDVRKAFRRLSKRCHPDAGGDSKLFVLAKWAEGVLSRENTPYVPGR